MHRDARGFTLIEFIIVVAITAIIAGFGLPAFDRLIEHVRTTTTLSRVTTSLMLARGAAITRGEPVTACPSSDGQTCTAGADWSDGWIVFADPARTARVGAPGQVIRVFDAMPAGLSLQTSAGRSYVRYLPSGLASGTNATFRICRSGRGTAHLASVIVSNTGRARTEHIRASVPCAGSDKS